jgi:glycosyltransferase involved in cell wall biosynthesis
MMRVLQVSHNDAPPFPAVCRAHERALRELGADVSTIYLSAAEHGQARDADRLAENAVSGLRAGTLLGGRFRGARFDLCVAHRYKACVAALVARRRVALTRVIAVAHEFGFFANGRRRLVRRLVARDIELAGVSPALADELSSTDPLATRAHVLGDAVDLAELDAARPTRVQARAELGIGPDELAVGVVGRLTAKKRPELALDVLAALKETASPLVLHYLGDGEARAALEQRASELGVSPHVRHHGFVRDAARTMSAFDAIVFTSDRDSFGMVLVEALASGVPVLAADSRVARDVMGPLGSFFDHRAPAAAATKLATLIAMQPSARDAWASDARARVIARHSVAALAGAYAAVLGMDAQRRAGAS